MINALVTKNGQSALISLPAKRIGLARDLASIGVASPPSELYPHDDELTVGLKYFGTDDFSGRLITLIQSEDSLARVNTLVELYGDLPVAQREKVKASVLSGEMTSLNDFKNSILENKSPEIVQNYYCPLMCTLYLRNRYIDDERANLDIVTGTEIIAIADIGRWDGRYIGYSEIKSGKISDCLYSPHDYSEWYVDSEKEFRCTDVHHDGRNHILYRKYKENATEDEIEHLKDLIYDGKVTQEDIDAVTEPLGEGLRMDVRSSRSRPHQGQTGGETRIFRQQR